MLLIEQLMVFHVFERGIAPQYPEDRRFDLLDEFQVFDRFFPVSFLRVGSGEKHPVRKDMLMVGI